MINISREALMLLITLSMLLLASMIEVIISFIDKKFNHNLSHRLIDSFIFVWYFVIFIVYVIIMLNIL